MEKNKKIVKKKIQPKKSWLETHIKKIAIGFMVLFLFQSFRGCISSTGYEREILILKEESDSLLTVEKENNFNLNKIIEQLEDRIQYLEYELKIAGIKVEAADERAKAIQTTAEKVKNNTTTTIKIEADTSRNKIK